MVIMEKLRKELQGTLDEGGPGGALVSASARRECCSLHRGRGSLTELSALFFITGIPVSVVQIM